MLEVELVAPVVGPTAVEALEAARRLHDRGVGIALGQELLLRNGAAIVGAVSDQGRVFADARAAGTPQSVVSAVRQLAGAGASWVTVDGRIDPEAVQAAAAAGRPYATRIVVVVVPPEAPEAAIEVFSGGQGRGRTVSRVAASLAGDDVDLLVPLVDIGVVSQVGPDLGIVAAGLREAGEVSEARRRGAGTGLLAAKWSETRSGESLASMVEAAAGD